MKNIVFLILIISLVLVSGCAEIKNDDEIKNIEFETISKGSYSGHKEAANYVINSVKELEDIGIKIPKVDFSQFSVIAVYMGEFNTGGYEIKIIEIIEKSNGIEVKISKTFPKPGSLVTQALSQPYHIIKIQKTNKQVIFEGK